MALPAHQTKHLSVLEHPIRSLPTFSLRQSNDGATTGSGLWLGAQVLAAYLLHTHRPQKQGARPRAIELGAGVGLTGLVLAALGYDVVATDVPVVLPLLRANVALNASVMPAHSGTVDVRELDWTIPPERWRWDDPQAIASSSSSSSSSSPRPTPDAASDPSSSASCPPFDLILTADTIYHADLVTPLLQTLHHLARSSSRAGTPPRTYVALERRDPALVDAVLEAAARDWGFVVESVPRRKLQKAMERAGMGWPKEDREGVEVWKFVLPSA